MKDLFGPGSSLCKRIITDYIELEKNVLALKELGFKIVLTSGTFDLLHVGHCRYLEKSKELGGDPDSVILIVGVDSDEKVKKRKGPKRPIVPQQERLETICHIRHVDLIVLKEENHPKHHLVKTVRPDVLIKSLSTNGKVASDEMDELKTFCKEIKVLEPQATTSTSARIRMLVISTAEKFRERFDIFVSEMNQFLDQLKGDHES